MKKIPDLRGLDILDAKELLRKNSIKYIDKVKKVFSFKIGDGKVVKAEKQDGKVLLYESNRKFFLFVIIGTATVVSALTLSLTYGTGIFNSVKEQIIEIIGEITAPELETDSGWGKERVVRVVKDAKGNKAIDHYEYCVRKNTSEECDWKETYTKNAVISKTGTWHVIFRGVDTDGKKGRESTIIVYVDNEAPEIKEFKVDTEDETNIKVTTKTEDKDSGIDKIMYSLDGINYTEGKEEYTYTNLVPGGEYTLYVKAVDKVGNEKIATLRLVKKTLEEIELEKEEEKETKETEKEWDIPKIDLKKLPLAIEYGEKYDLPSRYDFGNDEGTVVCKIDEEVVTDTSKVIVGEHTVVCVATSNHQKEAKVQKTFEVIPQIGPDEVFDGWIRLNLYYPEGTTNWEWRLGGEDGIRTGYDSDSWQDYTGPILIKLEDTGNVYIRYKVKGEPVIIAPNGKVVVDIEPTKWTLNDNETTKVKINYDVNAKTKKYRINGGNWQDYTGEFEVEPNTLIEAKATKEEKVYDSEGELQYTKNVTGTDTAYVSQYLKPEEAAPVGPGGVPVQPSTPTYDPENPTPENPIPTEPRRTVPTPGTPSPQELAGPVITANPSSEIVEETTITITPQQEASKIYYRINNGTFKVYTEPFTVTNNCDIYAYYVSAEDGQTSLTSGYRVNNIKIGQLPYVRISANPDTLTQSIKETTVTITGTDYDTLEYSLDGTLYQEYTSPLTIKQSTTVYARGTNQYGETKEKLVITTETPPKAATPVEDLTVHIEADPASSEGLLAYTTITITYDQKAENKYYSIDGGRHYQEYTGPFRLTENATVVGYATSTNGRGTARKVIDYLAHGIISPLIKVEPDGNTTAYSVVVEIEYDQNATIKQYKIGNGEYQDYTGPFEVNEETTIWAYNRNSLNEEKTSSKTIGNIVPEPRYTPIDLGDYYQLKLNYPDVSSEDSREYKWKETGTWKTYNTNGILLIKQEAKDKYDLTADGIEITDTKGKKIKISMEHVYVLDCPASELSENIFMRWDTVKPKTPTINLSTDEATKEVEVTISYAKEIVEKEYKIVYADGTETDWQEYTGSFKIEKNNTIIYAKGKNRSELESDKATKKITNIDEIAPTITLNGDLTSQKRSVPVQITAIDDLSMYMVKWDKGNHDVDYFNEEKDDNGRSIKNGSTVTFTENGTYTIYAVDSVGNETVKELKITNIDLTAPDISVNVLTPGGNNSIIDVEIDYGDAKDKYYKIGNTENWLTYTDVFQIKALDVYKLKNEDNSITVSAKGVDTAGNESIISENIYSLYLNVPAEPIVDASTIQYPTITEYGWTVGGRVSITYDQTRNDLINLYSLDNGETWELYTGPFNFATASGKILAKSEVSDNRNIYSETTKVLNGLASNALPDKAYDNNYSTSISLQDKVYYASISSGAVGSKIIITPDNSNSAYQFLDANNQYLASDYTTNASYSSGAYRMNSASNMILEVPKGAVKLKAYGVANTGFMLIDIQPYTTPIAKAEYIYPTISLYGWEEANNKVTIDYPTIAVQKFYKIDDGEWQSYRKPINVPINSKLYAYSIDKNNTVLPTLTYTSQNKNDKIPSQVYDNNTSTYTYVSPGTTYVAGVANDIAGYNIKITVVGANTYYQFLDSNNNSLESNYSERVSYSNGLYRPVNGDYMVLEVPDGTQKIRITNGGNNDFTLNEIQPHNAPAIKKDYVYPTLTADGWQSPYNIVTITYFATSVQKLYKIDNGEWLDYTKPIQVKVGSTITAYGIDKNGKSSVASTYTSTNNNDALPDKAYDNNYSTSISLQEKVYYAAIGEDIAGFNIIITPDAANSAYQFLDENNAYLESNYTVNANYSNGAYRKSSGSNMVLEVPSNTKKIKVYGVANTGFMLTDIQLNSAPKIESSFVYSKITGEGIDRTGYNEVTINYLQSLKKKKYKIDDGEWLDYTKPIKLYTNATISAKGIYESGNESQTSIESISIPADGLESFAYDNDISTYSNGGKLLIDSSAVNKLLNLDFESTSNVSFSFYDKDDNLITTDSRDGTKREIDVVIPKNSASVVISGTNLKIYETKVNDLTIKDTPHISISNEGQFETSKTVTIAYPSNEYQNEYSLDGGNTWLAYTGPFTVDDATTIYARSLNNGKYVSSSTYYLHNVYTTVTLDAGEHGTLGNSTLNLIAGEAYGNLPTPEYEVTEYKFKGWFFDNEFTNVLTKNTIVPKGDHTIYAMITEQLYIFDQLIHLNEIESDDIITDTTADQNIRYYGSTPNNYVYFNCQDYYNPTPETCQKWRIVGLFNNLTDSDDNNISAVKLIYPTSVGNGTNNGLKPGTNLRWGSSNARTYLNTTYYNNLTAQTRTLLLNIKTNYNAISSVSVNASTVYTQERNGNAKSDDKISWLYPSDFGFAAQQSCWNTNLNSYTSCSSWISGILAQYGAVGGSTPGGSYFVTPIDNNRTTMYYNGYLNHTGNTGSFSNGNNETLGSYPTVYIDDDFVISSGEGTQSDPYVLKYVGNIYTTVTLNVGDYGTVDNATLQYYPSDLYGELPVPTLTSNEYEFEGWYLDSNYTEKVLARIPVGKENRTLYARYIPSNANNLARHITSLEYSSIDEVTEDNTPDKNVRYYGSSPNNYIYFNCSDYSNQTSSTCQKWRIVGLFNNVVDSDNNNISAIKLLYPTTRGNSTNNGLSIGSAWGTSSARTYLNSTYYNSLTADTKNLILNTKTYYNNVTIASTSSNIYTQERYGTATVDDYVSWLYPSDFGFSAKPFDYADSSSKSCWNTNLTAYSSCASWMKSILGQSVCGPGGAYFVSRLNSNTNTMYYNGYLNHTRNTGGFSNGDVECLGSYPTIYISSNSMIKAGDGSSDNPYQLDISSN